MIQLSYGQENTGKGKKTVRFNPTLPRAGRYEVRLAFAPGANRASNVPVTVHHADGRKIVIVDQRKAQGKDKPFVSLGVFRFEPGKAAVEIGTADTDGYVIADAVQLLPAK